MAVSNAIGSNVFDINLGLGLPFLIRIAIQAGDPFELISDTDNVHTMSCLLSILANEYYYYTYPTIHFLGCWLCDQSSRKIWIPTAADSVDYHCDASCVPFPSE